MRPIVATLFLAFAMAAAAADPAPPFNPFPPSPVLPNDPMPKVDPDAVTTLPDDYLLIVKSDSEFILRASPKGKVEIVRAASPQIGGKFVGGTGKFKLETFKEKNVAIVMKMPGATGQVELIYSPVGAKDDSTDIARMVQLGTGPIPPPIPVDPKVDPKVDPVIKTFRVMFVYDSKKVLTPAQHSVIYAISMNSFLIANTTKCNDGSGGYRRKDSIQTAEEESSEFKDIWAAVKPKLTGLPCIAIAVNDKIVIESLAATPEAQITVLNKYLGK